MNHLTPEEKAKIALKVYHERGVSALQALEAGNIEEFFALLDKRRAAFHNFRALDHLAMRAQVDLAEDPDVQKIWSEIEAVNKLLSATTSQAMQTMESQVTRLATSKTVSTKYGNAALTTCKLRKYT